MICYAECRACGGTDADTIVLWDRRTGDSHRVCGGLSSIQNVWLEHLPTTGNVTVESMVTMLFETFLGLADAVCDDSAITFAYFSAHNTSELTNSHALKANC